MSDKRTVATDALETLGKIHEREEKRDAIHLAVEPVEAGEKLLPGERITVVDGVAMGAEKPDALGIVDPFLPGPVRKGQRFWFVMYPRMVHSLRHVWVHPSFPDELAVPSDDSRKKVAEAWIREHAADLGIRYDQLLCAAAEWVDRGDWFCDNDEGKRDIFQPELFWPHYETVTGRPVASDKRECFFTCSC